MEKVQGYSLSEIVATYRQRTELPSYILVVDWFEQAFRALAAMHATGRIHRSIGLEKIFVGADDEVRIEEAGDVGLRPGLDGCGGRRRCGLCGARATCRPRGRSARRPLWPGGGIL